ncbi:MAG: HNH endonuclease [Planctomycetota bacterium]
MTTPSTLLDPSVPLAEVRDVVAKTWSQVQTGEYRLCLGLRRLYRDHAHRGAGFARFADYAAFAFGIPEKLASTFSFLGEHLERLPRLRMALEDGEITYTKAREFAAVTDEDDVEWWIDLAKRSTNRQLERERQRYEARQKGEAYEPLDTVRSKLNPRQRQAARAVREKLTREEGKPVPEEKLLGKMLDLFTEGRLAGGEDGVKPPDRPYLTLGLCPACLTAHVPVPGENLEGKVSEWLEALRGGAEVHATILDQLVEYEGKLWRRDECPGWTPPAWEKEASRYVEASVRRSIEARDGHRCRRPGCGCPVPLDVSHLEPHRDGGPVTRENAVQHCATCNRMIEAGALKAIGRAPFEKYYLRDGTFLGWGFDPVPFEQGDPHVGTVQRAPPVPVGRCLAPV